MSISRFASYNLLGQAVPIVVSLVTMPLFVQAVGLERYGILSICWLLLGYFGVLDLGLSRAAAQRSTSPPLFSSASFSASCPIASGRRIAG